MQAAAADVRFWDRIARKYAADPIKDVSGYERTLARTRALLAETDSVLEIGCGTGATALRLAPHARAYLATDVSGEMIAIAGERLKDAPTRGLDFRVAAAEAAPAPVGGFDAVLAFNVLHLIVARGATLAAAHRVLKPGGLFVSKTPCLAEMNPLIRLAIPAMQWIGKAPSVAVFDGAALTREIGAAGFAIEETARHGSGRKDPRIFLVARKL